MANAITQRLLDSARQELARTLAALCTEVGAAESSILLPRGDSELFFFASNNAALMAPAAPLVPVGASFSGLAFRTGQTLAFADAAGQEAHNKAVDQHVGLQTHEFAAIPIFGQGVVGILTLVNRPHGAASRPFDMAELRRAGEVAQEMAHPLALLASLAGAGPAAGEEPIDPALLADIAALTEAERRTLHSLASSLLQNRAA